MEDLLNPLAAIGPRDLADYYRLFGVILDDGKFA